MKYLAFTLSPAVPRSITGRYKTIWGKKDAFQSSSPVLCTAKYRGGVQRTERLKNNDSNSNKIKSQSLPCRVPQHCGVWRNDIGGVPAGRGG